MIRMTRHAMLALGAFGLLASGCPDDGSNGENPPTCTGGLCLNENSKIQVIYDGGIRANGQTLSANLGVVEPGEEGTAGLLNLSNTGNAGSKLEIRSISVTSDPPDTFRLEDSDGGALPSSAAVWTLASISDDVSSARNVRLVFTRPTTAVAVSGTVTIVSNTEREENRTLVFPIATDELAPKINLSPTVVDFGNIGLEDIGSKDVTIANVGNSDLEVSSFSLTGPPSFKLLVDGQSFEANAETAVVQFLKPITVAAGAIRSVKVQFAPAGPEEAVASLAFYTNDPDENPSTGTTATLQANKGGPCIAITPQKAEFGGKLIGKQATLDIEIKSCGDAPVTISELRLLNDSEKPEDSLSTDFQLELGDLGNVAAGTAAFTDADEPLVLDVNEKATFQIVFTPDSENPIGADGKPVVDLGFIKMVSNTFVPEREVQVSGFGVVTECPTAIIKVQEGEEVIPQTKLHLIGSQSFAATGAISKYEWNVVAPPGSASVFLPAAAAPDPTFEVNVAGTYLFRLKVWDADNEESCLEAEYQIIVVPDEAIHVELLWNTPNDPDQTDTGPEAGADMDLHFTHQFAVTDVDADGDGQFEPWFADFYDCFWFLTDPNWGSFDFNVDDNPGLDRDDTNGAGPENLNLNTPENGVTYKVGVHYWNSHGFGESEVTVRVYIHSVLVFQVEGVKLLDNDLWEVATVAWPSGQVTPIAGAGGGPKIMPNYPNPIFPN